MHLAACTIERGGDVARRQAYDPDRGSGDSLRQGGGGAGDERLGAEKTRHANPRMGGVEQGVANAVGFALLEQLLAAEFNKPGHDIVRQYTCAFVGDGCLKEAISHEVRALDGTLCLNKRIELYDNNGISIDGKGEGWCMGDTPVRFE